MPEGGKGFTRPPAKFPSDALYRRGRGESLYGALGFRVGVDITGCQIYLNTLYVKWLFSR